MSFQIGQLRRNQFQPSEYGEDISYTQNYKDSINSITLVAFQDVWLSDFRLESIYSYYLQIKIANIPDGQLQTFKVKLVNGESLSQTDNVQVLRTFSAPSGANDTYTIFELAFTPNAEYDNIVFELERRIDDYQEGKTRKMVVEVLKFYKVINILDKISGVSALTKMGLQGPPGLLFVLNGEEMRIGRSGIYELYHETVKVNYIGFILKESEFTHELDYFIMDYKY